MTLAIERSGSPLALDESLELRIGQDVVVTQSLYERRGVTGGVEWDQPIADVHTFAGRIATVPNIEDPSAPQTYHVDRDNEPTYIVPTYDVPVIPHSSRRGLPQRFSRYIIQAI